MIKKIVLSAFLSLVLLIPLFSQQAQSSLTEAFVRHVIDGDTIILSCGERVRFIGVDAPELGFPGANEATRFVKERIEGAVVWLEPDGDDRDRFGRLRRYIWLRPPENPRDETEIRRYQLNALLLQYGLARVMIIGVVQNEALFRRLAAAAAARNGIREIK
jgi:endonuclease YncB( thermonuclease family)